MGRSELPRPAFLVQNIRAFVIVERDLAVPISDGRRPFANLFRPEGICLL